jgi:hypothetical protein
MMADFDFVAQNGVTNRWMSARLGEIVDVKDFGAVGNIATDDTVAIQAAIDKCRDLGAKGVYFPGGDYLVSGLTIYGGMILFGDGHFMSRIFAKNASSTLMNFSSYGSRNSNIAIRGLGFFGNGKSSVKAVSILGGSSARVSDINIEDCLLASSLVGVSLKFCMRVWLDNVHADVCETGFKIDTCADVRLNKCFASNGSGWGYDILTSAGEQSSYGEGVYLSGCTSNVQSGGLRVTDQKWGSAIGCSFTSCNSFEAVRLDGACWAWRVANSEMAPAAPINPTKPAVYLSQSTQRCILEGNYITLSHNGIYLQGEDHTVVANIVHGEVGSGQDIYITGCVRSTIQGNKCFSTSNVNSIQEITGCDYNYFVANMTAKNIVKTGANSVISANQFSGYVP